MAMRDLGVAKILASFSGGNDEGGYNDFPQFVLETEGATLDSRLERFDIYDHRSSNGERWDSVRRTWVPVPKDTTDADLTAIADHLGEYLDGEFGSFTGEFYVSGTVSVDAKARTTTSSGSYGEMSYRDF
jgi:hypothetical protein